MYKAELRHRDPEAAKAKARARYLRNGDKTRATEKRRRLENPDQHRNKVLRQLYKRSLNWFNEVFAAQGGLCLICNRPESNGKNLCVDHDHACCPGRNSCGDCIRGLLCNDCNKGNFRDDPVLMLRATVYVLWWRREHGRASERDVLLLKAVEGVLADLG